MKHGRFDVLLSATTLGLSCGLAIRIAVACSRRWEFQLLAVWKFILSLALSCAGLHRALYLRSEKKVSDITTLQFRWDPIAWVCLTVAGVVVGLIALCGLTARFWRDENASVAHHVHIVSISFGCIMAVLLVCQIIGFQNCILRCFLRWIRSREEGDEPNAALVFCYWFCIYSAFFSDWLLSAISGDWAGLPNDDVQWLYWLYFAAKRAPMFML